MRNVATTLLPWWVDPNDLEAVRGTARLRMLDRNLLFVRNRREGTYELWGPSAEAGGWIGFNTVMDDRGVPLKSPIPWDQICAAIFAARESAETVADRVSEHNRRHSEWLEREAREQNQEKVKYFQKIVERQLHGDGKWGAEDAERGFHSRWV